MEQAAQPEPEGLVFDLTRFYRRSRQLMPRSQKSGETAPSAEKEEALWFDPDEVSKPADAAENAGPDQTVPLECNQDVTPELREAEAAPVDRKPRLAESRQNLRFGRFPCRRADRAPLMRSRLQQPESRGRLHQKRRQSRLARSRKRMRQSWQSRPGLM